MRYEFHPEAEEEFIEAAAYYEQAVPGLGDGEVAMTADTTALLGALSAMTVLLGIYWAPVVQYTNHSLSFFIK